MFNQEDYLYASFIHNSLYLPTSSHQLTMGVFSKPIRFCHDFNQPIMLFLSNFTSVLLYSVVSCYFNVICCNSSTPFTSSLHIQCPVWAHQSLIKIFSILFIPSSPPAVSVKEFSYFFLVYSLSLPVHIHKYLQGHGTGRPHIGKQRLNLESCYTW